MKSNHEVWVSQKLSDDSELKPVKLRRVKENIPHMLVRLRAGLDVLGVIERSYAGSYDHEELGTEEQVEAVAQFFQQAHDWGDIGESAESSDRVRMAYELTNLLNELERLGLHVFGGREIQILEGGVGKPTAWPVSILRVVSKNSEEIKAIGADGKEIV